MTSQDTDTTGLDDVLQIDIVSDVVCPWCIVGFKQLEQAIARTGVTAAIKWHPFELNQDMAAEGENLREHIMRKYGSSAEQPTEALPMERRLGLRPPRITSEGRNHRYLQRIILLEC